MFLLAFYLAGLIVAAAYFAYVTRSYAVADRRYGTYVAATILWPLVVLGLIALYGGTLAVGPVATMMVRALRRWRTRRAERASARREARASQRYDALYRQIARNRTTTSK